MRDRRGQEPASATSSPSADPAETRVEALDDGDRIGPKEVVLRIHARYRRFGLYETAILGMLAQSTGWATAARECVDVAAPAPVISLRGAPRPPGHHRRPRLRRDRRWLRRRLDPGRRPAGRPRPDRDDAPLARPDLRRHGRGRRRPSTATSAPDVARIVLVDTFKDEAEEALRVAHALGDRLYGIRLDTPSERGRVTADLVKEVRARLDQEGYDHVKIVVSGGLNPERIAYFKEQGAPVDSFAVGSYISGATPIDFTGDIKEIDGRPIAKRGRIPGVTESPRLRPVDLGLWRDGATR